MKEMFAEQNIIVASFSTRYERSAEDQLYSLQISLLCGERKCRAKFGIIASFRKVRVENKLYFFSAEA